MEKYWLDKIKDDGRPVLLYGTGNGADRVIDILKKRGIAVCGVFASDTFVRSRSFRGYAVTSASEAFERFPMSPAIMCFGSSRADVIKNAEAISEKHDFYIADAPVSGGGYFDEEYRFSHLDELNAARSLLADDVSRACFDAVIRFRFTGRMRDLLSSVTPEDGISSWKNYDCMLDIGAYTGDTASEFIDANRGFSCVAAVEPDARNYRKLSEKFASCTGVVCVNAAAGIKDGDVNFTSGRGRGGSAGGGTAVVSVKSVDTLSSLLPAGRALIKIDAEGAEAEILRGGENFIREKAPSLHIAAYHRKEDLFALPLLINGLFPGRKIYLRRKNCIPAWEISLIVK